MKPILIDSINDEFASTTENVNVNINGKEYNGWVISKPLNYDSEYLSKEERQEMADAIMEGKAIAVCFFEDLSDEDRVKWVKEKIEKLVDTDDKTLNPNPKSKKTIERN